MKEESRAAAVPSAEPEHEMLLLGAGAGTMTVRSKRFFPSSTTTSAVWPRERVDRTIQTHDLIHEAFRRKTIASADRFLGCFSRRFMESQGHIDRLSRRVRP